MKITTAKFRLCKEFVGKFEEQKPEFGFNGLGDLVYKRSYSRLRDDGITHEEWYETVERVVNGTFNMMREHCQEEKKPFDLEENQKKAQKMYSKMFEFKFLPAGRGLWAMGTPLIEERKVYEALNNCAFVSTQADKRGAPFWQPFAYLMGMKMLGVGVGFDTRGAGQLDIKKPSLPPVNLVIEDSREGWVESLKMLLQGYFEEKSEVAFDYSKIRPEGALVKGFGGVSSGSAPLKLMHETLKKILNSSIGKKITSRIIVDIMNIIGVALTGIRASGEAALGAEEDSDFIYLKDYERNPDRKVFGWTSHNTVFAKIGMDYSKYVDEMMKTGEPGLCWLENMQRYGRMCDLPNDEDSKALGGPPCMEQTLESYEMSPLVETFPHHHESYEEFEETLELAFLYVKTVTLGKSQWDQTNEVVRRNRRVGCSVTGIAQFLASRSMDELKEWCSKGYSFLKSYDRRLSATLGVSKSIKLTCVKPSGTVSLLAGATAGLHYPESRCYIRRVRIQASSELVEWIIKHGYTVEQDLNEKGKLVVEIPVCLEKGVRSISEVSMREQTELVATLQGYWADNQVSCSIRVNSAEEAKDIPALVSEYQHRLKGICFLNKPKETYKQLPYEEITEARYHELNAKVVFASEASKLAEEMSFGKN